MDWRDTYKKMINEDVEVEQQEEVVEVPTQQQDPLYTISLALAVLMNGEDDGDLELDVQAFLDVAQAMSDKFDERVLQLSHQMGQIDNQTTKGQMDRLLKLRDDVYKLLNTATEKKQEAIQKEQEANAGKIAQDNGSEDGLA
jgi:hypothetical protein